MGTSGNQLKKKKKSRGKKWQWFRKTDDREKEPKQTWTEKASWELYRRQNSKDLLMEDTGKGRKKTSLCSQT